MKNTNEITEEIKADKFGARVYALANGKALVKQTVKSGPNATDDYVIDGHKEKYINLNNDVEIAEAVRQALSGQLSP